MTGRKWLLTASGTVGMIAAVLLAVTAWAPASSGDEPGEAGGPAAPAGNAADIGFAQDMAVHHQQAVEMSFIIRDRTEDEEVRLLAYDIINTQANQRGMMLGWLESWGAPKSSLAPMAWMQGHAGHGADEPVIGALDMPGMASEEELEELRAASGREAEVQYLRLMTEHHRSGVDMAEAAVAEADTELVTRLAQGMAVAQESEISLMADMLAERGA